MSLINGNIYLVETIYGEFVRLYYYSDKLPIRWHRLDLSGKKPTENVVLPNDIIRVFNMTLIFENPSPDKTEEIPEYLYYGR